MQQQVWVVSYRPGQALGDVAEGQSAEQLLAEAAAGLTEVVRDLADLPVVSEARPELETALGQIRAVSFGFGRTVALQHRPASQPNSALTYLVTLFLKRQCDRTLGAALAAGPGLPGRAAAAAGRPARPAVPVGGDGAARRGR